MDCKALNIPYYSTKAFSNIVVDYVNGSPQLSPFYTYTADIDGVKKAIEARLAFSTDRNLLVTGLTNQYSATQLTAKQQSNLQQLSNPNCFTITTAHQPNIFTGHLYFIYKILHAIKLADHLKNVLPENDFVPVYYMGSEDADLDELGEVYVDGISYHWKTKQTGAVGRMKVDDELINIIKNISGQLLVLPFGNDIIDLIKKCYSKGVTIEQATFQLVNALFAEYGLIVLLPDNAALKSTMLPVFEDELLNGHSFKIVERTSEKLAKNYKAQAYPREINLFYLIDDKRERIEKIHEQFNVLNTDISFSKEEMLVELKAHPERFSPNVILRGLFQETILPNIAFVGGGGELAYWLQLKDLFEHYKVPYPVQVLRNSFMLIEEKLQSKIDALQLTIEDVFKKEDQLLTAIVKKQTEVQLSLQKEKDQLNSFYDVLKTTAGTVDTTLKAHTENLHVKAFKKIEALEKKMLRAEKLKFEAQQRQLHHIKSALFPKNNLQERVENFMAFYAKWGSSFIETLYVNSLSLEQEFTVLLH